MKLLIYHERKWKKDIEEIILNHDPSELIILVSEHRVYKNLITKYPKYIIKYYFVDEKRENNEDEICDVNEFIDKIQDMINSEAEANLKLVKSYSNSIYDTFYIYVMDTIKIVDKIFRRYEIEELILMYGNLKVDYFSLTFSEGERIARFFYKRSWMLNYYIYHIYKERIKINWLNEDSKFKLNILKKIKVNLIISGKAIILIIRKLMLYFKKNTNILEKNISRLCYLLIVRTPLQVEPLIPIYDELKKNKNIKPLFITMENYLKPGVNEKLFSNNIDHINLFNFISIGNIIKVYYKVLKIRKQLIESIKSDQIIKCGEFTISIDIKNCLNELSIYWIDNYLRHLALDIIDDKLDSNIVALTNTEIENHNGAYDYYWTRKKNVPLYTIQWVTYLTSLKPKMAWSDTVYMMNYKDYEKVIKKSNNKLFKYIGPVAYDTVFDNSNAKPNIKTISIFTQPDEYKLDYIEIIDDLVDITMSTEIDLVIKLHPREYSERQFRKRYEKLKNVTVIKSSITSQELIKKSDLAITITSGIIIQSLIIGTPCISINYDNKRPSNREYLLSNAIQVVSSREELVDIVLNFKEFYDSFKKNRLMYIRNELKSYEGKAAKEFITKVLEDNT